MAHLSSAVEYALHCLLWIVPSLDERPSTRDLAELQGVSPSFLAKIFQKLEKAGIVEAAEGFRGGYHLARSPEHITILDVVDAIEGATPLFNCQENSRSMRAIRRNPPGVGDAGNLRNSCGDAPRRKSYAGRASANQPGDIGSGRGKESTGRLCRRGTTMDVGAISSKKIATGGAFQTPAPPVES